MKSFAGFPEGKQPYTPVPDLFLEEVLSQIDHLGELKVTLHLFWLLAQKQVARPCARYEELAGDRRLLAGLGSAGLTREEALREALDRAVVRGTLLRAVVGEGTARQEWYFVNSGRGRRAVDDLLAGRWTPGEPGQPVHLEGQRPNIFSLYEQTIGPLSPLLSEELIEAEGAYPMTWIEDAFREAAAMNKRSWRYIQAILERWAAEGKDDETSRRGDERDRRRFIRGEYADYIEH